MGEMKRIITILLALVMAVLLCGCGKSAFTVQEHHGKRFEVVEKYDDCRIIVDTETGVLYANLYSGNEWSKYNIGFILSDSYGKPLLWDGYDAREDRVTTP